MTSLLLLLHLASVIVWVGGMFFAYVCLRPVAAGVLEPPLRLRLWAGVLERFFVYVWIAVLLLPVSGAVLLAQRQWAMSHVVLAMVVVGCVMIGIFADVALRRLPALKHAVAAQDWPQGGGVLGQIRQRVGINLLLGALTVAIVLLGRGW